MILRQTPRSDVNEHGSITIAVSIQNNRPANLLDLISNPPALLYSSPAMGMLLCLVYAATLFYDYFTKRLSASLLHLSAGHRQIAGNQMSFNLRNLSNKYYKL